MSRRQRLEYWARRQKEIELSNLNTKDRERVERIGGRITRGLRKHVGGLDREVLSSAPKGKEVLKSKVRDTVRDIVGTDAKQVKHKRRRVK